MSTYKGLIVEVYKSSLGDCTADGMSGKRDTLILTSIEDTNGIVTPINAPFEGDETNTVKIVPGHLPGYWRAIPVKSKKSGMIGPMFGGNFIYCSDSRFPMKQPVAIHDRYETVAQYNELSQ